jgi:ribosome-binding protein aMBF1 (putative translation factor)
LKRKMKKNRGQCEGCGRATLVTIIEVDGQNLTVCVTPHMHGEDYVESCYAKYTAWKEITGRPTVKEFLEKVREIESRPNK